MTNPVDIIAREESLSLERYFITQFINVSGWTRAEFDQRWTWQYYDPARTRIIPGRRFEFDFVCIDAWVAVEVQGGTKDHRRPSGHNTDTGITADCEKSMLAQLAGYKVFAFTRTMIEDDPLRYLKPMADHVARELGLPAGRHE